MGTTLYMTNRLWEILVPTIRNDGRPIKTRFHKVWDAKVRAISGGLTIMAPVKGQWKSKTGTLFLERMIPVRIVATREHINKIIDLTLDYYEQEAVLCYSLSDEVILKHRVQKGSKVDVLPSETSTIRCDKCNSLFGPFDLTNFSYIICSICGHYQSTTKDK